MILFGHHLQRAHLFGARTENCPLGMKTGDQISPPLGYVGDGLQMQTDLAISPAGDLWVMNNWEDIAAFAPRRRSRRGVAAKALRSSTAWQSPCVRRRLVRRARRRQANGESEP
jgi:hypothetical protein